MKAKVGDFLVVKGTTTERHDQHAEIIEVRSQDGSPPYVVRWLVTYHEATVRRHIIAPRDRRHEAWDDWDGGLDPHGDWPEQG